MGIIDLLLMAEVDPRHAELCRALALDARTATLATIAREPAGYPYASLVSVAFDERGRPVLFLSQLAEHTRNLEVRAEASLMVAASDAPLAPEANGEPVPAPRDPLAMARMTLTGPCVRVPSSDAARARAIFLGAHPEATRYAELPDFAPFLLEPLAIRYVGGFGRMSWVAPGDYASGTRKR